MTHRYIKLPLIFGMAQMLMHAIIFWLTGGTLRWLWVNVGFSFVSGCLSGFVIALIHSRRVKAISKGSSEEDFELHQKRTVILHLPYDRAFELCKESLTQTERARLKEEDYDGGRIVANTRPTLTHWGRDVVSYQLEKIGEQLTRIELATWPKLRTVMADNGQNLKRVKRLSDFLTEKDWQLNIGVTSKKRTSGIPSGKPLDRTHS